MAELTYGEGGMTIEQVASLTVYQMYAVKLRRRDKWGKLLRVDNDIPEHVRNSTDSDGMRRVTNRRPLAEVYVRARMATGLTKDQAVARWEAYIKKLSDERVALNEAKKRRKK